MLKSFGMSEVLQKIQAKYVKPAYTDVKVGDTVRVYTRIKEGEKERTQYFEGLVIRRRSGIGTSANFTVRRIASGVGVERTFALHSPVIERIQVQRGAKVRRATLYTMRGLTGKAARLTEKPVRQADDRDVAKHPWVKKYHVEKEAAANQEVELEETVEVDEAAEAAAAAAEAKQDQAATTEADKILAKSDTPETKAASAESGEKTEAKAETDGHEAK